MPILCFVLMLHYFHLVPFQRLLDPSEYQDFPQMDDVTWHFSGWESTRVMCRTLTFLCIYLTGLFALEMIFRFGCYNQQQFGAP